MDPKYGESISECERAGCVARHAKSLEQRSDLILNAMMPKSSLLSWSLPFSPYFVDCMMMAGALPKKGEKSGGFACRPRFAQKVCMPKSRLLYGNSEGLSFISLPTQNMKNGRIMRMKMLFYFEQMAEELANQVNQVSLPRLHTHLRHPCLFSQGL